MSKFTMLVEVEVERDSGKFAGRDEIFEKLEAVVDEVSSADLSGLGADSSSEYSVVDVQISELEARELKGIYRDYDNAVIADVPGDAELRKENKHLRSKLKELNRVLNEVKDRNIKLLEKQEQGATRIFQRDTAEYRAEGKRTYIDDKTPITFMWGDNDSTSSVNIEFMAAENGCTFEIRSNGWADLLVQPNSSNVIFVKIQERH